MSVYEGSENYIFVSYAHKDSEIVIPIIKALQQGGFRVWYDQGIEAGSEWPAYIEEHLNACSRVLVCMSPHTVASENCRNEINYASYLKREMLVVYLEDTELAHGLGLQLNSKQSLFRNRHETDESFISEMLKAKILQCCKEGGETDNSFISDIKIPHKHEGTTKPTEDEYLTDREATIKAHLHGGPAISRIGIMCSNTPSVAWPQGNYTQSVDVSKFSVIHFHTNLVRAITGNEEKTVGIRVFNESGAMVYEDISKMMFRQGNNRFSLGWIIKDSQGCAQPVGTYTAAIWLEDSRAFEFTFTIYSSAFENQNAEARVKNQAELEKLEKNLRHIRLFIYHVACWIVYFIMFNSAVELFNSYYVDPASAIIVLIFGVASLVMTIFHCKMVKKTVVKNGFLAFLLSFVFSGYFGIYLGIFFIYALANRKKWKERIRELKAM